MPGSNRFSAFVPSRETCGLLLGLLGVTIFGGTLPATRIAVASLDPLFIGLGRAAVAGLLASVTLIALRRPWPKREQIKPIIYCLSTLVLAFPILMALAIRTVSASHGGIVLGILPLTTAAMGSLILGDRPPLRFWFFAILGTSVVVAFALHDAGGGVAVGDIYMLAAALATSVGYAYIGQLTKTMPGWEVICWMLVFALPITAPAALFFVPREPVTVATSAWIAFAYVSIFSMFLGFFPWNAGLAMGGLTRVSQVQLLQTFITLGISALINHEHIDALTIVAAMTVIVLVALGRSSKGPAPAVSPDAAGPTLPLVEDEVAPGTVREAEAR